MMVNTVTGPVAVDALGKTLMHEHLVVGFPGWESDTTQIDLPRQDMIAHCVERIAELKSAGFSTMLDPCPNDLGRDVSLMAEVASKTGFNIIFATGLYHQHLGGAPYWLFRQHLEPDIETRLVKLFIIELTEGVASTGVKAGVIKVATFKPPFTDYEKMVFRAAATASIATGAPITTHTEAILGEEQVKFLTALGVPAHKIIIGHSCGTSDNSYHTAILKTGAYIGFDRFGLERLRSDEDRVESLTTLIGQGYSSRLILSHDCVWCWRGLSGPAPTRTDAVTDDGSMRLTRVITPLLLNRGITQGQIDSILIDNPRRYFAGT